MKALIFAAICCTAVYATAQSTKLSDWTKLIDGGKCDAAKALCTKFADSSTLSDKVDAQKCLSNVALCGNSMIEIEGDDVGGGTLRGSYAPEAIDEALVHLNLGIKLAPQDLSIHMGRLHVLEISGRYDQMIKALDESCTLYRGKEAPDSWLAYAPELADLRQYSAGLEFMKVIDKHYPDNSDILGNIGAFLSMLNRPAEALPYLQKAAELAPKDPINTWDLGRAYDHSDQISLADQWYQKGIALMTDADQRKNSSCLYAEFVENKLKDSARACRLEKQSCPKERQTACSSPTQSKAQ